MKICLKIGNIQGGIFNLFFMSPKEMKEELNIKVEELDIIKMLQIVKELIKKYNLIPKEINYKIGIEGLNYLNSLDEIDILYELGVRSVNIVWNNQNKFGGGTKSLEECGLTTIGKKLVHKLVEKKIAIDLSHANEKTFYDIIENCKILKSQGYCPIIFASHSNCKSICNVPRNLTDEQILKIKEMNGIIGLVSYKKFCIDVSIEQVKNKTTIIDYEQEYVKHINHVRKLLNGIENIAVSTDDMGYYEIDKSYYKKSNVFSFYDVKREIIKILEKNGYSKHEIEKILYYNACERLTKQEKIV